jgi:hypothetical protein
MRKAAEKEEARRQAEEEEERRRVGGVMARWGAGGGGSGGRPARATWSQHIASCMAVPACGWATTCGYCMQMHGSQHTTMCRHAASWRVTALTCH